MIKREKSDFRYSGAVDTGDETKGCWLCGSILAIRSNQVLQFVQTKYCIMSRIVLTSEEELNELREGND
jgi:hypothetical protein